MDRGRKRRFSSEKIEYEKTKKERKEGRKEIDEKRSIPLLRAYVRAYTCDGISGINRSMVENVWRTCGSCLDESVNIKGCCSFSRNC